MNYLSSTFDDFVDDLLDSDVDLLKGELDFLLIQHLFNSIDLEVVKKTEFFMAFISCLVYYEIFMRKIWVPFLVHFIQICFFN